MNKIGFIGTGVMGTGIINNLLKHGNPVVVYNRTKAHAQAVLDNGAQWADSPAALTQQADVIFTMVGFPQDVEQVYFGYDGILANATTGQYLVDMTTSKPSLAQQINAVGAKRGVHVLDAPVSGDDIGAKNGTLTVMVGGDAADLNHLRSLFDQFSKTVSYYGPAGSGQHTKMANQIMIAGMMTGLTEALVYAKAAHLDLKQVIATLQGGAAENFSLGSYGPRILKGDYTPGFFAKHFLKGLRIALDEADAMGLNLPATSEAKRLYGELVDDRGLGNDGTQALIKLWWH
ncbi:NAD(P)-dependent oxidoreductase [Limosilactobacillus pontis]|uniref:3-hydroxyisobutyrate dehydrogenase related beta-hydroxyacid dehydrogenase n=1 Tax=Limosilactobacillus pontis DSM 8475 TaxID=1423794 RepID=A0A922PWV1_9LACO|nr:NAD(P)-dependent oxidoreductase [Limosilactobacillus pontis]KRM37980.1 3-hydroxyisobutyrate dehydrogenase related beta-hydroxyacid dehydrogenase [Limosilactobacillus pontis DSM 8475]QFV01709.1 NAD-binding protein [Limosilactobacillus pontis]